MLYNALTAQKPAPDAFMSAQRSAHDQVCTALIVCLHHTSTLMSILIACLLRPLTPWPACMLSYNNLTASCERHQRSMQQQHSLYKQSHSQVGVNLRRELDAICCLDYHSLHSMESQHMLPDRNQMLVCASRPSSAMPPTFRGPCNVADHTVFTASILGWCVVLCWP